MIGRVLSSVHEAVPVRAHRWVLSPCSLAVPFAQTTQPAPPAQAANDETARINAWFETKFEEQLAFSPIQQTFLGRKSGAIDDMSHRGAGQALAWQRASVAEMKKSFDYAKLSPEAQTSYDTWIYQLQQAEAAAPVPRPTPTSSNR